MTPSQHTVIVEGRSYNFISEPDPVDRRHLMIEAPGVVTFEVDNADGLGLVRARDILRSAYHEQED